jgi:enoyl-CoA hydratase/carnithine racemase
MSRPFSAYSEAYEYARMRREDGIIEIRLHTKDQEFVWGPAPHRELPELFREVGDDRDNRVVILTGTGAVFTGPEASPDTRSAKTPYPPQKWYAVMREARQMLMNELDIDVPMIAAINGPAFRHMELALVCDVTIASEDAVFEDAAHFTHSILPPGDGMNIVLTELIGLNRSRYLTLTGQRLNALQAQSIGLINEVVPKDQVLARAWSLARYFAKKSDMLLRHTRLLMIQNLKKRMLESLSEHMLFEGMTQMDGAWPETGAS